MNVNSPTPGTMPPPNLKRPRQSAAGAGAATGVATTSGSRAKRRKNEVDDAEGSEAGGRGSRKGKDEDGETEGQIKVCLVIRPISPSFLVEHLTDVPLRSTLMTCLMLHYINISNIMIYYLDGKSRHGQKSLVSLVSNLPCLEMSVRMLIQPQLMSYTNRSQPLRYYQHLLKMQRIDHLQLKNQISIPQTKSPNIQTAKHSPPPRTSMAMAMDLRFMPLE